LYHEWLHLALGTISVFFGVLGGSYALRALIALYRSPEMLESQRAIWLPILIGGAFITISGPLHFMEHSAFSNVSPMYNIVLLRDILTLAGFSFIVVGVVQYSRIQIEYYKLKQKALQKISEKNKH